MKIKTLTFLLLLIAHLGYAQVPKNAISIEDKEFNTYFQKKENIPVVKGKILNLTQEDIQKAKINYSIVTPFDQFQIEKSCTINSDGSFELELDYAFPYQQIWINAGKLYYAGIYANTDLYIELDADIIKSHKGVNYNGPGIKYLGKDGELNTFLNNHVLFKREKQLEISKSISLLKRSRGLSYDAFILKYDSLYSILSELDNEFIKQNPSQYAWILSNERQSNYYADLCIKHWGKEMSTELFDKVKAHKSYLTSNSGMGFYNYLFTYLSLNSNKGKTIDYGTYRNYSKLLESNKLALDTIQVINKIISQKQSFDTIKYKSLVKQANNFLHDTLVVSNTINTIEYLDKLFERSKSDFLKIKISSKDPNEQKLMTETVLGNIQTQWCKGVVQEQYNNSLEKLASINKILQNSIPLVSENQLGDPIAELSFGAKLYKVDNIKYETLLANLKSSFKNKALIIDFWATWCGPCIQEMPFSKKLHKEVKDLPVEFVYLCTSSKSNIENWKSKIAEFELEGTHIFVEQDIENGLMNLFSVSGFPSYVFINTKGDYKPGVIKRMSSLDKDKLAELIGQ